MHPFPSLLGVLPAGLGFCLFAKFIGNSPLRVFTESVPDTAAILECTACCARMVFPFQHLPHVLLCSIFSRPLSAPEPRRLVVFAAKNDMASGSRRRCGISACQTSRRRLSPRLICPALMFFCQLHPVYHWFLMVCWLLRRRSACFDAESVSTHYTSASFCSGSPFGAQRECRPWWLSSCSLSAAIELEGCVRRAVG